MMKRLTVLALAVWFGGLNCLAGCGAELLAAHLPAHDAATTESRECSDDCCRRESAPSRDAGQRSPEHNDDPLHSDDCCPFLTAPPTLASKKTEVNPARADGASLRGTDSAAFAAVQIDSTLPELSPPDGRETHQRLSVLRL